MTARCRTIFKDGVPVEKQCCACGQVKPVSEFGSQLYKNGVRHYVGRCFQCIRAYKAQRYQANLDKSRERSRAAKRQRSLHERNGTCSEYVLRCAIWKVAKEAAIREFHRNEAVANDRRLREWSFQAKVKNTERDNKTLIMREKDWCPFGVSLDYLGLARVESRTPYDHLVEKEEGNDPRWLELYISRLPPTLSRAARDLMDGLPITLDETRQLQAHAFKLLQAA